MTKEVIELDVETLATSFAEDRLSLYLQASKQEIEDYKIIANAQATEVRGRTKINKEDQEFIDEKQKYYDLFSSDKFRDFYVFTTKQIFSEIEDKEVIAFLELMSRVDKVTRDVEQKLEDEVVSYSEFCLGDKKFDA